MTDAQILAVAHTAVTLAQRLVIALVAVSAARAGTIRLTLDDVDLAGRRDHARRSLAAALGVGSCTTR